MLLCCNELEVSKLCKLIFLEFLKVSDEQDFFYIWHPVWAPGRNAPLIRSSIWVLYILFPCLYCILYIVSFPTYLFFFTFVTYLLSCLSFPLRIDPLCFQVGFHKRRLNLTLVFVFISCCNTFLQIDECMLLLCSSLHFSIPSQGLGNRL